MVFGHPAVAVAIDQGVKVSIEESGVWKLEGSPFEPSRHPHISHIIRNIFQYSGPPLDIEVDSSLFSAAGMGSSAALSNAFGAAMYAYLNPDEEIDPVKLAKMAHSAEATAQKGRASPTDTATSALGGCVVVSGSEVPGTRHVFDTSLVTPEGKRDWSINTVDVPKGVSDAWLVIGFTGKGSPTGKMVAKVAKLVSGNPERMNDLETIANITKAGLTALSAGNLEGLGIAMDACHDCLKNLEVSSPRLDRLVEAARPHSLGTKLTGAGGGGCSAILCSPSGLEDVTRAIESAGWEVIEWDFEDQGVLLNG